MAAQDSPNQTSLPRRLIVGSLVAIAILALAVWFIAPGSVSTNDAQIDGHIHPLNARVSGTIVWVNPIVDDTHFVKAGTVLARLDSNDYEPTVDRLQGDVQSTEAQLSSAKLNVDISEATSVSRLSVAKAAVDEAQAEKDTAEAQSLAAAAAVTQSNAVFKRAEDDRKRYLALFESHEISQSEYDQRATEAATAEAQLRAAEANLSAARQHIASAAQRITERKSDVLAAQTAPQQIASARANVLRVNGDLRKTKASLKDAVLNLSYTEIVAPVDGVIGRKQIEVGQRISAGSLILTLTPPDEIWAIANFKETQLQRMKIGQTATIHIDSSGEDLSGTVESLGGATGAKYALLPPENATGNYVKVVQRVPVRVRISSGRQRTSLVPGMSIEVRVDTRL
ncbi:HlyD family secretion protein [Granulicella sibirica]|uniref:Membrane fusion component of tripartite multidrug resistance system n=1 Tax=Granulicella sibirica TaxID=2479048 RepID=A0A4Q0T1R9_9BACT|nr:HlyD family secretion protein [Granulicella sibirica]RXH55386.1 Membrane fusion component of tripartite multidrug resistance system [Granulicella sibirica]